MKRHAWNCCTEVSSSTVDDELVLVYGDPQRIAVLNRAGAQVWERLQQDDLVTEPETPAHDFLVALREIGLAGSREASDDAERTAFGPGDEAPRVMHTGSVEVLVYGFTGGPMDKPGRAPSEGGESDWPFVEPPGK